MKEIVSILAAPNIFEQVVQVYKAGLLGVQPRARAGHARDAGRRPGRPAQRRPEAGVAAARGPARGEVPRHARPQGAGHLAPRHVRRRVVHPPGDVLRAVGAERHFASTECYRFGDPRYARGRSCIRMS